MVEEERVIGTLSTQVHILQSVLNYLERRERMGRGEWLN